MMRRILFGATIATTSVAGLIATAHMSAGQPQTSAVAEAHEGPRRSDADPLLIDLPGCRPTAADEHTGVSNRVVSGTGTERLQAVIYTKAGGPAGESYVLQADELRPLEGASLDVVDPKDGTLAWFWSDGHGGLRAALNGFRTDHDRAAAVVAAVTRGALPEGYVVERAPFDFDDLRSWEYECERDGERHRVHVIQGSPAARALYVAGSRHTTVAEQPDDVTVLLYGGEAPIRKASPAEWDELLSTDFGEDHR
jgi:hypothetical protein